MRRWQWVAVLVVLVSACGGGDSDGGLTTFTIDDVVVTLEVPDGAVPAGTEIEIRAGNVPAELAQISDMTIYAFDLEPSGLEFSEPATITFTLAAPGDTGTPLASVIIEDSEGKATFLSTETTRYGDKVEVTALVDHFSEAYLTMPKGQWASLNPELLEMRVGETKRSEVKFEPGGRTHMILSTAESDRSFFAFVEPVASDFIEVTTERTFMQPARVVVTCLEETDGVIENAYEVTLFERDHDWMQFIAERLAGPGAIIEWYAKFLGDVKCDAADSGSSTADDGPTVEEPEESVAVDVGAEPLVGEGTLTFTDFPGGPSTPGYEAPFTFMLSGEGDESTWTLIQQPSSQETVGMVDPTGSAVITSGGEDGSHQEWFALRFWNIGSDQLGIVGVTFGGPPDLAERGEELVLALTSAEIVDGVLVVAPGADPITGGPLDPEQALELATEMVTAGVDPADFGLDWFMAVHGVFDLSDPTETGQGVPEHSVTIGNIRYVIRAVTEVRTGADLGFTVCGYDVDSGEPLEGETGYFTIGNDPGSSLASHANGIFGSDGCFSGSVPVKEPPGNSQILTSDGDTVKKVVDITILPEEDPKDEDPEQFLRLLVDGLRGDVDFLVSRLNEATIVIYGEEQCRTTLAGLQDPQTELEIREIGPIGPWDYVVDGVTTRIPDALPVEVQRLADGQTIIQELHWQLVDGSWTWFSDCGEPIRG